MAKDIKIHIQQKTPMKVQVKTQTLNPSQKTIQTKQIIQHTVSKRETTQLKTKPSITITSNVNPQNMIKQQNVTTEMPITGQVWIERQAAAGKQTKLVRIISNTNMIVLFCSEQGIQNDGHSIVYAMPEKAFYNKWKNTNK